MTHGTAIHRIAALLALSLTLLFPLAASADEYADVNQLMKSGKYAEAIAKADQFIAAKPRDPQMRFLKGVAQAGAARPADAIATYTQLTQDYPELPEPYNNLAALYAAQGQFDKARDALEEAVRANPSYAIAHENLGDVYTRLAMQSYTRAQQLDARNTSVPAKLAMSRQLLGTPAR
jgi:Flp pilus assembly protein TadD